MAVKLRATLLELRETEGDYVKALDGVYSYVIALDKLLSREELTVVFANVDDIRRSHSLLADQLDDVTVPAADGSASDLAKATQSMCQSLLEVDFVSLYGLYCANHARADDMLKRLQADVPGLSAKLQQVQQQLQHPLPLASYLLKPVQRLLKYPLLVRQLLTQINKLDGSDQEAIIPAAEAAQSALDYVQQAADDVNVIKRRSELEAILKGKVVVSRTSTLQERLQAGGFSGDVNMLGSLEDQAQDIEAYVIPRVAAPTKSPQPANSSAQTADASQRGDGLSAPPPETQQSPGNSTTGLPSSDDADGTGNGTSTNTLQSSPSVSAAASPSASNGTSPDRRTTLTLPNKSTKRTLFLFDMAILAVKPRSGNVLACKNLFLLCDTDIFAIGRNLIINDPEYPDESFCFRGATLEAPRWEDICAKLGHATSASAIDGNAPDEEVDGSALVLNRPSLGSVSVPGSKAAGRGKRTFLSNLRKPGKAAARSRNGAKNALRRVESLPQSDTTAAHSEQQRVPSLAGDIATSPQTYRRRLGTLDGGQSTKASATSSSSSVQRRQRPASAGPMRDSVASILSQQQRKDQTEQDTGASPSKPQQRSRAGLPLSPSSPASPSRLGKPRTIVQSPLAGVDGCAASSGDNDSDTGAGISRPPPPRGQRKPRAASNSRMRQLWAHTRTYSSSELDSCDEVSHSEEEFEINSVSGVHVADLPTAAVDGSAMMNAGNDASSDAAHPTQEDKAAAPDQQAGAVTAEVCSGSDADADADDGSSSAEKSPERDTRPLDPATQRSIHQRSKSEAADTGKSLLDQLAVLRREQQLLRQQARQEQAYIQAQAAKSIRAERERRLQSEQALSQAKRAVDESKALKEVTSVMESHRRRICQLAWSPTRLSEDKLTALHINLEGYVYTALKAAVPSGHVNFSQYAASGHLIKLGRIHRSWRHRWFVFDLRRRCVMYYKDKSLSSKRGSIQLNAVCRAVLEDNKNSDWVLDAYGQELESVAEDSTSTERLQRWSVHSQADPSRPGRFHVVTPGRTYHLEAPTGPAAREWVEAFNAVALWQ